jgi:hypothetical protein
VIGIAENMSGYVCRKCGETIDIFKTGGGEALAREMGVPFLGRIPIDPEIVRVGDEGAPSADVSEKTPGDQAFAEFTSLVLAGVGQGNAVVAG